MLRKARAPEWLASRSVSKLVPVFHPTLTGRNNSMNDAIMPVIIVGVMVLAIAGIVAVIAYNRRLFDADSILAVYGGLALGLLVAILVLFIISRGITSPAREVAEPDRVVETLTATGFVATTPLARTTVSGANHIQTATSLPTTSTPTSMPTATSILTLAPAISSSMLQSKQLLAFIGRDDATEHTLVQLYDAETEEYATLYDLGTGGGSFGTIQWSPDGTQLAFSYTAEWSNDTYKFPRLNEEIYVINADGTGLIDVSNEPAWDTSPNWSPDGAKIAFQHHNVDEPDPNEVILVVNKDGTGKTKLIPAGENLVIASAAWLPDSSGLTYAAGDFWCTMCPAYLGMEYLDGSLPQLLIDPMHATKLQLRSNNQEISLINFTSSDGEPCTDPNHCRGDIFLMGLDGKNLHKLPNSRGAEDYAYSPDMRRIVYMKGEVAYVVNADGTGLQQLTNYHAVLREECPAWSPDSTLVAFRVQLEAVTTALDIVDLASGQITRIYSGRTLEVPYIGGCPAWRPSQ